MTKTTAPSVLERHACQGLNACAGHGYEGSGTKPGDGRCATAIDHSCTGTNSCSYQGGCGYKNGNVDRNWVPGENQCAGAGGCQTPILASATFAKGPYKDDNVWDRARTLFRERMVAVGKMNPSDKLPDCGPVEPRRQAQSG